MENYQLSTNIPKPVYLHRSAVRAGTTGSSTHQSPTSWIVKNSKMNYFKKMKKKTKGKKAEALKKKIVTAGELFIAGALLTAGGNMVDSLSEDSSSPQISAGEVNWIEDKTKALIEFKTNQHDSNSSTWGVIGYVLIGLGMVLLAIPTIRLIHWIRISCGDGNGSHTTEEEESEETREPVVIKNSVKYSPTSEDRVRLEYDSQPIRSMSEHGWGFYIQVPH